MTLYIVGGSSRAGKSTIAHSMLTRHSVPYLSLDYIISLFHYSLPEYGISHDQSAEERARALWPHIEKILEIIAEEEPNYLIEGEPLLPSDISVFCRKHPGKVRACFVGYAEAEPDEKYKIVRSVPSKANNWVDGESDTGLRSHIGSMIDFSKRLRRECLESGMAYFDTSVDFDRQIARACDYLWQA